MTFLQTHLLSAIVFLPLASALLLMFFPRHESSGARGFALVTSLIDLALVMLAFARFVPAEAGLQLTENHPWIEHFGISYALGVDGIALLLVGLTAALAPIVILSTKTSVTENSRDYLICLLLLQTGMLGAFVAADLFLFYVFWEVMLIPMYFLIGMWGGRNRVQAALKFFLYTMAGSLLMLVAILYTVWAVRDQGGLTFSWLELSQRLARAELGSAETYLFLAFALAFAIKVPMFPFHTWLPDAHVEAPTGGSVVLAGVLLKLGAFGFLRYAFWLFPKAAASFLPALGILAVVGIIYGAALAMAQSDLKRLVAYSSVSHLGFVMLGLTAMTVTSVTGSVVQMVNHGISTGALFLLVGVIYERRHTRDLDAFGGLARVMPRYAVAFVIIMLSSIGLPGLNGFVGELLILTGSFRSTGIHIDSSAATVATFCLVAANVVALIVLAVLARALFRKNTRVGLTTKILAMLTVGAGLALIVAPPVDKLGFGGGLLMRPLLRPADAATGFGELFAVLGVIAVLGVVLGAVYMLSATQRVFFGPLKHEQNAALPDLGLREVVILLPFLFFAVFFGVYPKPMLHLIESSVVSYTTAFRARAALPPEVLLAPRAQDRRPRPPGALPSLPGNGPAPQRAQP